MTFCKPKVLFNIFLEVNNHIFLKPSNYEAKNYIKSPKESSFRKILQILIVFVRELG